MRTLVLAGAALIAALSGCGPRMSIADQCSRYGYPPGSVGHANCQMQLSIADQNLQQRRSDNLTRMGMQMVQQPAPSSGMTTYRFPSGNSMTCSQFGNMVSCH